MGAEEQLNKITNSAKAMEEQVNNAESALNNLFSTSLTGGKSFEGTVKSLNNMASAAKDISSIFGKITGMVPVFGGIFKKGFDILGSIFETTFKSLNTVGGAITSFVGGIDAMTRPLRMVEDQTFGVAAGFGRGYKEARQFSEYILKQAPKLATAEFGWQNLEETSKALSSMENAGIPFDILRGKVNAAGQEMDLYNAVVMHAKGLHLDTSEYVSMLSNAIIKQGMSADDAMLQMAEFGDISDETGLSAKSIAGSLQGLSNQFNKLGMSAEFGRPILEGFTKTLSGMGLGIENALDLSTQLSSSLAKLATNYSSAYITFQRGGLNIGTGGGALGASIGLQSKMLEIEKAGGDQGQLAMEMTKAMKDTIASFTGGQVITVQQAAEDPRLQAQFYAQTKLLGNLYDIQDPQTAVRTLDLMSQLDDAVKSGDQTTAQKLAEQIDNARKNTNETVDELKKLNAISESHKALQMANNITSLTSLDVLAGIAAGVGAGFEQQMLDELMLGLNKFSGDVETIVSGTVGATDIEAATSIAKKTDFTDLANNLADIMKKSIGDRSGTDNQSMMSPLIDKIDELIGKINTLVGNTNIIGTGRSGSPYPAGVGH